jgi:ubiquinone/menaquinone biosynthesis C-methylase UbiE
MSLKTPQAAHWNDYWGRRAEKSVSDSSFQVGVEQSEDLIAFWNKVFAETASGPILDLCCGAGAVTVAAHAAGHQDLVALDISADAVAITRQRVPSVQTFISPADEIPLPDGSVALVVSQFGVEYADWDRVAAEIRRVLQPGGSFRAIAHKKDGRVDAECRANLGAAKTLLESPYLPVASAFFEAVFEFEAAPSSGDKSKLDQSFKDFADARDGLKTVILSTEIAARLHQEVSDLYRNRRSFSLSEIESRLQAWTQQIHAYAGRMDSMLAAAMQEDDAETFLKHVTGNGRWRLESVEIDGQSVGWDLHASV